jgi:NAD(P)-dependent dehydrogenase (short-subunit alcohol dehydrogenase family)
MKNVVISGVGRGIGKALALKFLSEGFKVFGTTTTGESDFSHENLKIFKLDLADEDSIQKCTGEILKELSEEKIFILFNNAGVLQDEDETKINLEKLRSTMEVNLFGTISFTEKLLENVENLGRVDFMSSSAGSLSRTGHGAAHFPNHYPAYRISKCAINMYMRTLASMYKDIIFSSIHPGRVKTPMTGFDGDITPDEAAKQIFDFVTTNTLSGYFWFEGGKMDW